MNLPLSKAAGLGQGPGSGYRSGLARRVRIALTALLLLPLPAQASISELAAARACLNQGQADEALRHLNTILTAEPDNAEAQNLLCRVYYSEERWDEAIRACERAVQLAPKNSTYHVWLGRAYGEKADRTSFVQAYGLGKRVRAEFETAVQLDPRNVDALSDLGEFYAEAPSIIGGGTAKAEGIAARIDPLDPARAQALRGGIAEQKKDPAAAEAAYRASVAESKNPAEAWAKLASFYRTQKRWDDMMQAVQSAIAADHDHGPALVDASIVLVHAKRDPELAAQLLQMYLDSPKKSEEAPAFQVHLRLSRLLSQAGDDAGAGRELAAALALAKDYKAANRATNTGR